jgi:hypothetical protein
MRAERDPLGTAATWPLVARAQQPKIARIGWMARPSTHPVQGEELRALRRLQRESPSSPIVFVTERGSPFTTAGFARMI